MQRQEHNIMVKVATTCCTYDSTPCWQTLPLGSG